MNHLNRAECNSSQVGHYIWHQQDSLVLISRYKGFLSSQLLTNTMAQGSCVCSLIHLTPTHWSRAMRAANSLRLRRTASPWRSTPTPPSWRPSELATRTTTSTASRTFRPWPLALPKPACQPGLPTADLCNFDHNQFFPSFFNLSTNL